MDLYEDYQFALDGVAFGVGQPVECDPSGFAPGDSTLETTTNPHPTSSGVVFGRDRRRAALWAFDLYVNATNPAEALAALARLRSVWWNEDNEDTPGAVSELVYRLAGRSRAVYGRGRKWTPTVDNRMINGMIPITADFEVVHPGYFEVVEQSAKITANGANQTLAGIQAPLEAPLIGVGGGEPQASSITIGGDKETWLVLEFKGGINPYVEIGGWRYELDGSLGTSETVTADARPWRRGITSSEGGAFGATRTSRLASVKLKPGKYSVVYGNLDFGGAASVTVRWQNNYKSL